MKRLLTLLPLFLMITGCNQSPPPADSSVITSRSEAWETAFNAKDIDALVDLYESHARLLPPNAEMNSGGDALRAEFGAMIDAGLSVELTSIEATVSGDIGYNVGTYTLRDGDDVADVGKYMETWHRGDDGQWRYSNDIWNSDMPAAAIAAATKAPETHLMISHEVKDVNRAGAVKHGVTDAMTAKSVTELPIRRMRTVAGRIAAKSAVGAAGVGRTASATTQPSRPAPKPGALRTVQPRLRPRPPTAKRSHRPAAPAARCFGSCAATSKSCSPIWATGSKRCSWLTCCRGPSMLRFMEASESSAKVALEASWLSAADLQTIAMTTTLGSPLRETQRSARNAKSLLL